MSDTSQAPTGDTGTKPRVKGTTDAATGRGRDDGAGRGWSSGGTAGPAAIVIAVLALVVAGIAGFNWYRLDAAGAEDDAVEEVVGSTIATLTNWDADELEGVRTDLAALTTDRFRDEAVQLIDDVGQGLEQANASSVGEVLDIVADANVATAADGDEVANEQDVGLAMAVVRQGVTNLDLEEPDVSCWSARAVTRKVDGRWLVDDLQLYGPNTCPEDAA